MLQFQYNMYGLLNNPEHTITQFTRYSHLRVFIYENGYEKTEIWNSDAFGVVEKQWTLAKALVGRVSTSFRLVFKATDRTPYTKTGSYVAVANVQMTGCRTDQRNQCYTNSFKCLNGNCISRDYLCDNSDDCGDSSDELRGTCVDYNIRCNFEHGTCEWGEHQPSNAVNKWQVSTGFGRVTDGPTRDHTTGISIE